MPVQPEANAATTPGGALSGILVADFSRVLAGPLAASTLADLGATTIKVEHPERGDDTRHWGPPFVDGMSTYFMAANRNKRSVSLDLHDPADHALAIELVARADVVIENFRPGTAERLGLAYETLRERNPGVVYASITGFGRTGPGASLGGYDFLVQAQSGLMSITGTDQPTKVGVAVVDLLASLQVQVGVLAALAARQRTGRGQRVEVSLLGAALAGLANQATAWLVAGQDGQRMGNRHPSIAPYESFRAADRTFVVAVGNDRQFERLCHAIGLPRLADDERFLTNAARVAARAELHESLAPTFATAPAAFWVDALTRHGVPGGLINTVAEAFDYAESLGLPASVLIETEDGGRHPQVASPIQLSDTPVDYRLPPPGLGEHDDAIKTWLRCPTDTSVRPEL